MKILLSQKNFYQKITDLWGVLLIILRKNTDYFTKVNIVEFNYPDLLTADELNISQIFFKKRSLIKSRVSIISQTLFFGYRISLFSGSEGDRKTRSH